MSSTNSNDPINASIDTQSNNHQVITVRSIESKINRLRHLHEVMQEANCMYEQDMKTFQDNQSEVSSNTSSDVSVDSNSVLPCSGMKTGCLCTTCEERRHLWIINARAYVQSVGPSNRTIGCAFILLFLVAVAVFIALFTLL